MYHAFLIRPALLGATIGLLGSCSTPEPVVAPPSASSSASSSGAGTRFPQTPEILALEREVAQDAGVREILARRAGTRIKLRQTDSHVTAYVVEQRDGRWVNISNQLPQAELTVIAAAVSRAAQSSNWKPVGVEGR